MLNMQQVSQETIMLAQQSLLKAMKDGTLAKTINVATGLTGYILEAPAKQLVPLMSPFRQTIPRKVMAGSNAVNWKAITALSMPKATTTENAAGALFTTTVDPRSGTYKNVALRGQVSREAVAASEGFDPALAKETANTLLLAMKLEEIQMLGGNITALGGPASIAVTEVDGVGSIVNDQFFVNVRALTLAAANRISIDRPADYASNNALLAGSARTSIDPASDGLGPVGTEANVTTTGTDNGLKITWTPEPDAAAYAVYVGTTTGAANLECEAVVTQCSVTLTSLATGGDAADEAATSADTNSYDGIIQQMNASGSGAYIKDVAGTLTGTGGEVVQLQDAFAQIYNTAKIGKFRIQVSGQDSRILTRLGISAGAGPTIYVDPQGQGRTTMMQGYHVGSIVNATTGDVCPVDTLPWLPGGMILILPTEVPYNDANIPAPIDWVGGYDWERWDYASTPSTGPIFPFETRCWGVLRLLFPGGCGLLVNIFKG